jgi:transposase-like protein
MMEKKRTYSAEFKQEAVALWQTTNKTAVDVEQELGITPGLLGRWKKKLQKNGQDAFPGRGRQRPEQEEVRRLKQENRILRQERDILKKAVAIFSTPSR